MKKSLAILFLGLSLITTLPLTASADISERCFARSTRQSSPSTVYGQFVIRADLTMVSRAEVTALKRALTHSSLIEIADSFSSQTSVNFAVQAKGLMTRQNGKPVYFVREHEYRILDTLEILERKHPRILFECMRQTPPAPAGGVGNR